MAAPTAPPARPPWEERVAVASLALLLAITLVNVAVRYLTDQSVAWTEELSVFLMVVLTLSGAAMTCLTFLLLAALFGRWVADQVRYSETSMGLGVPLWWYGICIPPLCMAVSGRAAMVFLRLLRRRDA